MERTVRTDLSSHAAGRHKMLERESQSSSIEIEMNRGTPLEDRGSNDDVVYGVGELSRLCGLRRSTIDYFTQLGLTSPRLVNQERRQVKRFGGADVRLLQRARELLEAGNKPRQVLAILRPDRTTEEFPVLTHAEVEILRLRYLGEAPRTLEQVGEELGVSRQYIHAVERSGLRKLARRYFLRELDNPCEVKTNRAVEAETENGERFLKDTRGGRTLGDRLYGEAECPNCGKSGGFVRLEGRLADPGAVFRCPDGCEFSQPPHASPPEDELR